MQTHVTIEFDLERDTETGKYSALTNIVDDLSSYSGVSNVKSNIREPMAFTKTLTDFIREFTLPEFKDQVR